MSVIAVIQARMGSTRLPGKVLRSLGGHPVLVHVLERIDRCETLDGAVIATSVEPGDDPIAELCRRGGVRCERGSETDVAGRFLHVVELLAPTAFVRICADSPLIDPRLVDRAVRLFHEVGGDLVTNVMPRSFPPGQSVEVISADAFQRAVPRMVDPSDREHVTRFFYHHADEYTIRNFRADEDFGDLSLAVDTDEDFARLEALVADMTRMPWEYDLEDILRLHRRRRLHPAAE